MIWRWLGGLFHVCMFGASGVILSLGVASILGFLPDSGAGMTIVLSGGAAGIIIGLLLVVKRDRKQIAQNDS